MSSNRDIAITIDGAYKSYKTGTSVSLPTTMAEAITERVKHPLKRKVPRERFWAVNDVSFEIPVGEAFGLIGRNGAGKSTLLKLLSKITFLSKGRIDLHGRVGVLLEVGTGFHPELTGRENIYLNGAILGMKRKEISKHFDEIVDMANVEDFLDTPVKRYSSGMYVRLAFAVAAHLEVDILLVDEVLAVGDVGFQQRCLGKMGDIAESGRTVIFVSHQMPNVLRLCSSVAWMDDGKLRMLGPTDEVVDLYTKALTQERLVVQRDAHLRPGSGEMRLLEAQPAQELFDPSESKVIDFRIAKTADFPDQFGIRVRVVNERDVLMAFCDSHATGMWFDSSVETVRMSMATPWLKPGHYRLDVHLHRRADARGGQRLLDDIWGACFLDVSPRMPYDGGPMGQWGLRDTAVLADYSFQLDQPFSFEGVQTASQATR